MIVDFHCHLVPRAVRDLGRGSSQRDWYGIDVGSDSDGRIVHTFGRHTGRLTHPPGQTIADRIADMDRLNIDMQVLSLSPSLSHYTSSSEVAVAYTREVNDEWAELGEAFPGRLSGFASLPLQDTDASIAELERAVKNLGLLGAFLPTHVNNENWDEDRLVPVLAAAEELNALVFFHPIRVRVRELTPRHHLRNLLGNPWETAVTIGSLIFGGVLDAHPDLLALFAHGGGFAPYAIGRFDHGYRAREDTKGSTSLPSTYLKRLLFDSITHDPMALRYLIDTVGSENVVLGTDYPADMGGDNPVKWLQQVPGLSDAERFAILEGNADRVVGNVRSSA